MRKRGSTVQKALFLVFALSCIPSSPRCGEGTDMGQSWLAYLLNPSAAYAGRLLEVKDFECVQALPAVSGPYQVLWASAFGGSAADSGRAVVPCRDGGFAMAGYTKSSGAGDLDFLVLRLDADGGMIWGRTFGESFHDMAYAITETSDGCFVVAGERRLYSILDEFNLSSSYRYDFGVVKIDSGGDLVWSRTHGGRDYDRANAVVECREGGYAVAGHTQSFGAWYEPEPHAKKDLWILRLDHDGEVLWERLFGAPNGSDGALSMRQCRDGGYIVCGFTSSYGAGSYDCLVLKLDGTGALQWSRTAGGPKFDQAHAVIETSCGRFIAAGETSSWGEGESDGYVLCYDRDGNLLWSRTYGGPSFDRIRSITETAEGTFVLAGYTSSSGAGHKDFWVLTIDGQGRVKRSGTLGLEGCDEAFSVSAAPDGSLVAAGNTSSAGSGELDCLVIRFEGLQE